MPLNGNTQREKFKPNFVDSLWHLSFWKEVALEYVEYWETSGSKNVKYFYWDGGVAP